ASASSRRTGLRSATGGARIRYRAGEAGDGECCYPSSTTGGGGWRGSQLAGRQVVYFAQARQPSYGKMNKSRAGAREVAGRGFTNAHAEIQPPPFSSWNGRNERFAFGALCPSKS